MTAPSLDRPVDDLVTIEVSVAGSATASPPSVRSTRPPPRAPQRPETLLEGDATRLTVDLGRVTFLDSAGLCVLAAAHRRASGRTCACGCSPPPAR